MAQLMARITVEDCLKKIDSQYELVMLAKERTSQLNSGNPMLVPQDNDKHTVVALREIAEGKVSTKTLEDLGIDKLRKHQESKAAEVEETEIVPEDDLADRSLALVNPVNVVTVLAGTVNAA